MIIDSMTKDGMMEDMIGETKEVINILDRHMTGGTIDIMIDTIGIIMTIGNVIIMTARIVIPVIIMMSIMNSIINALIKVMIEPLIFIIALAAVIVILLTTT